MNEPSHGEQLHSREVEESDPSSYWEQRFAELNQRSEGNEHRSPLGSWESSSDQDLDEPSSMGSQNSWERNENDSYDSSVDSLRNLAYQSSTSEEDDSPFGDFRSQQDDRLPRSSIPQQPVLDEEEDLRPEETEEDLDLDARLGLASSQHRSGRSAMSELESLRSSLQSLREEPEESPEWNNEEEPLAYQDEEVVESSPSLMSSATGSSSNGSEEEDEESIEAYMQQLLQRVKGSSGGTTSSNRSSFESQSSSKSSVRRTGITENKVSQPVASPVMEPTNESSEDENAFVIRNPVATPRTTDHSNYAPRKQAPERGRDMEAMRELANVTARKAIEKSDRRRLAAQGFFKLSVACIGLAGALFLLLINGTRMNMALVGMFAGFGVAALWGWESLSLISNLAAQPSAKRGAPSLAEGLEKPLPADTKPS